MENDIWLGDKLPTIYEVAQTINHYAKGTKTQKRTEIIVLYNNLLRNMWVRAFREDHVLHRTTICKRLNVIMKDFDNKVLRSHDNSSLRVRNKKWQTMELPHNKRGPKYDTQKISSLFDIGKDMEKLTGMEKIFYEDQCSQRQHLLSQEIDEIYKAEKELQEREKERERQNLEDELNYIYSATTNAR